MPIHYLLYKVLIKQFAHLSHAETPENQLAMRRTLFYLQDGLLSVQLHDSIINVVYQKIMKLLLKP